MDEVELLAEIFASHALDIEQRSIGGVCLAMVRIPVSETQWECVHGQGKTREAALIDLRARLGENGHAQNHARRPDETPPTTLGLVQRAIKRR